MSQTSAWLLLVAAGLCEVVWAVALKYAEGFTRVWPSAISLAFMLASVALLAQSMKTLPLGTAYAVWTGIGAVGTALCGIVLFSEPAQALRVVSIALIVAGIAGLKLAGGAS